MKIKIIFMALALALSVNVEAQSFFEKVGKAVERGVEKGVQRAAEKQTEKAVNKTVDKATSGSSSSSSKPQQPQQAKQTQQAPAPSSSNNTSKHEYVDLGLPSGTKWATCNIGASSPEDAGSYFAWGETSTKSSYKEATHNLYGKEMDDISGKSAYDAATAIWGKEWRMPTKAEFEELMNTCHGRFVQQNGVWGVKFTSKTNGNSIFLPVTGYMSDTLKNTPESGYYWTSSPRSGFAHFGARFRLTKEGGQVGWGTAFYGYCIRPVAK